VTGKREGRMGGEGRKKKYGAPFTPVREEVKRGGFNSRGLDQLFVSQS
jgi:hypothetical protein